MVSIGSITITSREAEGDYNGPLSTHPEWHAFIWSVGYVATFFMALAADGVAATVVLAQIIRVSYFAMSGQRLTVAGHRVGILPDRYLKQIRDESPHWFGGLIIAFGVVYALDHFGFVGLIGDLARLAPGDVIDAIGPIR